MIGLKSLQKGFLIEYDVILDLSCWVGMRSVYDYKIEKHIKH